MLHYDTPNIILSYFIYSNLFLMLLTHYAIISSFFFIDPQVPTFCLPNRLHLLHIIVFLQPCHENASLKL